METDQYLSDLQIVIPTYLCLGKMIFSPKSCKKKVLIQSFLTTMRSGLASFVNQVD